MKLQKKKRKPETATTSAVLVFARKVLEAAKQKLFGDGPIKDGHFLLLEIVAGGFEKDSHENFWNKDSRRAQRVEKEFAEAQRMIRIREAQ